MGTISYKYCLSAKNFVNLKSLPHVALIAPLLWLCLGIVWDKKWNGIVADAIDMRKKK